MKPVRSRRRPGDQRRPSRDDETSRLAAPGTPGRDTPRHDRGNVGGVWQDATPAQAGEISLRRVVPCAAKTPLSVWALEGASRLGAAMIDFSDREDVQRWLDTIEPAKRRREVAVALAARAALRVTPLLGRELTRGKRSRATVLSDFVLPSLRATALAWAAAKYPAHGSELRASDATTVFDAFGAARRVGVVGHRVAATTYAAAKGRRARSSPFLRAARRPAAFAGYPTKPMARPARRKKTSEARSRAAPPADKAARRNDRLNRRSPARLSLKCIRCASPTPAAPR